MAKGDTGPKMPQPGMAQTGGSMQRPGMGGFGGNGMAGPNFNSFRPPMMGGGMPGQEGMPNVMNEGMFGDKQALLQQLLAKFGGMGGMNSGMGGISPSPQRPGGFRNQMRGAMRAPF